MLEEEHERGGAEEGGVLAVELGFAKFGRAVRGRLRGWVVGDWRRRCGRLRDC